MFILQPTDSLKLGIPADPGAEPEGGSNQKKLIFLIHVGQDQKNFYDSWKRRWQQHAGRSQDNGLLWLSVSCSVGTVSSQDNATAETSIVHTRHQQSRVF